MRRSGVLSFPGITRWRLRSKDTRQWFAIIKRTAAVLDKMAPQKIPRHAGGAKARVHHHPDRRHLGPNRHLCHLMTKRAPKQKVFQPHICLYILHFAILDFWQGSHARERFYSRFADSWWSIHRLVHYQLRGNAADSHFDRKGSRLSESDSEDESWLMGTGILSIIIIYN